MEQNAPVQDKDNGIIKIIVIALIAMLVISCNTASLLGYMIIDALTTQDDQTISDIQNLFNYDEPRTYIDPDIDEESEYLLDRSIDNFRLIYDTGTEEGKLDQYVPFILANLQQNYEELSVKFNSEIPDQIAVVLTEEQDWYEIELGFDYDQELPYAGLTTYRRIVLLITEDLSGYENDFNDLLKHELVHIFQFEIFSDQLVTYPNWFLEGTAEYFSEAQIAPLYYYPEANLFNNLDRLSDSFESGELYETSAAYLVSHEFIKFLVEQFGEEKIIELMLNQRQYLNDDYRIADFEELFEIFFEQDCNFLYEEWYYREIFDEDQDSELLGRYNTINKHNSGLIVYNNEFFKYI